MTTRVAVLGGGVAGVTVASELAQRGVGVDLYESSYRLGGLHHSVTLEGFCFDIGAFIFSPEHELLRCFPFLLDQFVPGQPRYARITPAGRLDAYPLSVAGYAREEGPFGVGISVAGLLLSKLLYRERKTVPDYAKYYMGPQVYRRSGLQNYIQRLYGLPDTEVGLEFAVQRLRTLERYTPRFLLESQLRQSWSKLTRKAPAGRSRALVRPPQGFSLVYASIGAHLAKLGVALKLKTHVTSIRRAGSNFELTVDGSAQLYQRVVSTIPIPTVQEMIGIEPWGGFETMKLYSLFYVGRLKHDNAIQYNFTYDGKWKRITGFSKYYGRIDDQDYWVVETTVRSSESPTLAEIQEDFETHGRKIGLFEGEARMLGGQITDHAYPVFRRGYTERLKVEREKVSAAGIDAVGRQGAFEYLSSLETAAKARQLGSAISLSLQSSNEPRPDGLNDVSVPNKKTE